MGRRWVAAAMVAVASGTACAQSRPAEGERPDLQAQEARWQRLPGDVTRVSVDAKGRAWFEIGYEHLRTARLKQGIERAAGMKVPWLSGGRVVLHESNGRVWVADNVSHRLLGYQPGSGRERRSPQRLLTARPDKADGLIQQVAQ